LENLKTWLPARAAQSLPVCAGSSVLSQPARENAAASTIHEKNIFLSIMVVLLPAVKGLEDPSM
jgi:hypothetical protein